MGRAQGRQHAAAVADQFSDLFGSRRGASPALAGTARADVPDATPSPSAKWAGDITDAVLLEHALGGDIPMVNTCTAAARQNFLLTSEPLWDPNSATQKEYRGVVAVGPGKDGSPKFFATFVHGPGTQPQKQATSKEQPSLAAALSAINEQLQKKLDGKGSSSRYDLKNGGTFLRPLSTADVHDAVRQRIDAAS